MNKTIRGYVYGGNGDMVLVEGEFMFRTDDPEEYIQDIVIRTKDGKVIYIDEQNVVS